MVFHYEKRFITIQEFSEAFGYSQKHIRRLIHEGKIPAVRIKAPSGRDGDWRIDISSVPFESNSQDNGCAEGALTEDGVPHAQSESTHRGLGGQVQIRDLCTRSLMEKIDAM